jgi:drug/metabolite transporter (DMT)-like permease
MELPAYNPSVSPDPRLQQAQWPAAIARLLGAMAVLLCLDASGKWLGGQQVPVAFTTWSRYAGHFVIALIVFAPRHGALRVLRTSSPGLQTARGLMMLFVTLVFFQALKIMPLAQSTALFFLTPVLAVFMSSLFLKEKVTMRAWISLILGFLGVLIVVRPGLDQQQPLPLLGVALVLLAALGNATYQTLTRARNFSDSAPTQLTYAAAAAAAVLTASMPFWFTPFSVSPMIVAVLIGTGLLGALGHWLLITSFAMAPASVLSPWMFTQLLMSIGLGWVIFGQHPDATAMIGMAVVAVTPWLLRPRAAPQAASGLSETR